MDEENKNRINIEDLPQPEKELSAEEQKDVTGAHSGGVNVVLGDGSVRFNTGGNTIGGSLTDDGSKSKR